MEDARDMQGADDADVPDAEPGRSAPEKRDRNFVEVNRWSHDDHSKEQIDEFIRRHIESINDSAGLKSYPGAHKDRTQVIMTGIYFSLRSYLTSQNLKLFIQMHAMPVVGPLVLL
jgi:hypothetical protein